MNYAAAKFYLDLVLIVINLAIGLYVWWTNRDKITNSRFKDLEDRIVKVEGDVKHPNCQYHQGFEIRLDKLHGGIKHIEGRLDGIGKGLDMIQQHLINGGK